jgi:Carboxypeptidase regulatory-like domain
MLMLARRIAAQPRALHWLTLGLLLCGTPALAQAQASTGVLAGVITDPQGALVPSADLKLENQSHSPLTVTTDARGTYRFPAVLPGLWQLTITAHGFRSDPRTNILIEPGQTRWLDLALKIDIQHQQIDVIAAQLDSSPDRSLGAIVLTPSELDGLATNPVDLQTQLQMIAGSDPTTPSQLFVDGFTATRLPPKSSIREIRINQNPYSAQYDTIGLGRIEVFTKPGTDKLRGNLMLLGDDSVLNSSNPYSYGQPAYSAFYSEGAIGGPLGKTHSWFLSGDRQDVGAQSFVYATTSSTGPTYATTVNSPQTSTDVGPRLDFQLGKMHTLSFRYQFGRQAQDNVLQSQLSLPSQAIDTRHTDQTLQISDSQLWTEHAINETRFQFMRSNDASLSLGTGPAIEVQGAFTGGGNLINQLHVGQNRYELQDYFSLLHGNHLLRFGARVRDVDESNTSSAGYKGLYIFSSIGSYETTVNGLAAGLSPVQIRAKGGGASFFTYALGNPRVNENVTDLGLYAEDEWKIAPGITVDGGLRFETQSHIHDHADFAPRLNASWAIGANRGPNHDKPAWGVLRAGIGMFYQRFLVDDVVLAARENGIQQQQYAVNDPDFYPAIPSPDNLGPDAQPSIYRIGSHLHAPYIVQQGVSLDKQFFKKLDVSLDYSYYRGVDQFLVRNVNAPLPGTYIPGEPASGIRPDGTLANIYEYESEGTSKRNRIYLNVHYRTRPLTLYGVYIFGHSNANTTGTSFIPSNQYNLRQDYGRAANDLHNRAYFGGLASLPYKFQFDPILVLQSSMPFNITTGTDLNGDSQFNDRPAFATDLSRPSVYRTRWGNFDADPLPGQKIIPINYGTGPSFAMLQMLFARNFTFGPQVGDSSAAASTSGKSAKADIERKYQLNLGIEAQNVLNIVNGGLPVGVLGAPLFGHSTSLSTTQFSNPQANRILYLHMNLSF